MKKPSILTIALMVLLQACHSQGHHLAVGDSLPPFTLLSQDGKPFNTADYVGKNVLVIYFYPKDESAVCTKEACAFRDSYEAFTKAGAVVVGINDAPVETHLKFAQNHQLPFNILSDPGNKVMRLFGVPKKLVFTGRETFVVGLNGKVLYAYNSFLQGKAHADKALQFIQSIKTVQ
jgi:thioredoxin-dependent peroxiredoxin